MVCLFWEKFKLRYSAYFTDLESVMCLFIAHFFIQQVPVYETGEDEDYIELSVCLLRKLNSVSGLYKTCLIYKLDMKLP